MWKSGKIVSHFASWLIHVISSPTEDTSLHKNNVVISNMGSVEKWKSAFLCGEFLVASFAKVGTFPVILKYVTCNFSSVDCQTEESSTSGPCETPCGSNNGTRKVVWSEKIVAEAMYGGTPCDKEETSWTTSEPCKTDKIVPCTGEIFFAGSIFLSQFVYSRALMRHLISMSLPVLF